MHKRVQQLQGLWLYLYNHQFIRYLFVGGTTFILNESVLILLHGVLKLVLPFAVFMAYLVSFVYNFSLNRKWSFTAAEKNTLKKHIKPYTILFFFNLGYSIVFVSIVSHFMNYALATALSVATQTTWTFYVFKTYIFVKTPVA
jgi:putative flippase GtrA